MSEKMILIIDDEEILHDSIKEALEYEDYLIMSAYNGQEGLALIEKYNPTLVFLDLRMPAKDGFEVLEEVKKLRDNSSILVVLSGHCDYHGRLRTFELGSRAFLRKPFDVNEIRNLVYHYM